MIINANALHIPLADSSVHCVVTSPPYYGLRDYGVDGQLGLEKTPEQYIANMVAVFREVSRVLRDNGTLPTEQVNGIRARKPAGWDTGKGSHGSIHKDGRAQEVEYYETTDPTRNKRSVWSIATQAMPMAHFATYPEKLVEPCILAGTSSRGVCPKCGAPWSRVVDKKFIPQPDVTQERVNFHRYTDGVPGNQWRGVPRGIIHSNTINWKSGCACNVGDPVPAIVLDPFFGSGTTGLVALSLGRRFIGMDLSMTYLREIAKKRLITQIGTGL